VKGSKVFSLLTFAFSQKKVPTKKRGRWLLLYKKPVSGLGISEG
jgi:hypothetical protein